VCVCCECVWCVCGFSVCVLCVCLVCVCDFRGVSAVLSVIYDCSKEQMQQKKQMEPSQRDAGSNLIIQLVSKKC
jgi:hypothetical protein